MFKLVSRLSPALVAALVALATRFLALLSLRHRAACETRPYSR